MEISLKNKNIFLKFINYNFITKLRMEPTVIYEIKYLIIFNSVKNQ